MTFFILFFFCHGFQVLIQEFMLLLQNMLLKILLESHRFFFICNHNKKHLLKGLSSFCIQILTVFFFFFSKAQVCWLSSFRVHSSDLQNKAFNRSQNQSHWVHLLLYRGSHPPCQYCWKYNKSYGHSSWLARNRRWQFLRCWCND